ncbi:uncharacterized protein V6R79_013738 [Siganus canaliculatus]
MLDVESAGEASLGLLAAVANGAENGVAPQQSSSGLFCSVVMKQTQEEREKLDEHEEEECEREERKKRKKRTVVSAAVSQPHVLTKQPASHSLNKVMTGIYGKSRQRQ